jgi:hypothetical protein|eukprot:COSAG06_NODE_14597_length_1144_cov_1.322488_2_plen_68_part_00
MTRRLFLAIDDDNTGAVEAHVSGPCVTRARARAVTPLLYQAALMRARTRRNFFAPSGSCATIRLAMA